MVDLHTHTHTHTLQQNLLLVDPHPQKTNGWFSFSLWQAGGYDLFARTVRVLKTMPAARSRGLVDL